MLCQTFGVMCLASGRRKTCGWFRKESIYYEHFSHREVVKKIEFGNDVFEKLRENCTQI